MVPSPSAPCQMSPKTIVIFHFIVPDLQSLRCRCHLHLSAPCQMSPKTTLIFYIIFLTCSLRGAFAFCTSPPCQMSPKTTVIFHIIVPDWWSLWHLRLLHLASCLTGQRARGGVVALLVHPHTASSHQDPTAVSTLSESITAALSCNRETREACEAAASCFECCGNPCSQGNNSQWVMHKIP